VGRFETSAEFYRYREPYPRAFFDAVTERLALSRQTSLLDVACGPGNLVIGFGPYVGELTAVDLEPEMLRVARVLAAEAKLDVEFIEGGIEHLERQAGCFTFVTIGRALHWLPREPTIQVLERVIAPGGHIAICGSTHTGASMNAWAPTFRDVRRAWASDPDESRYKVDMDEWFAPSRFRRAQEIAVTHTQRIPVSGLIARALSFSITSPAILGERRSQFEAKMAEALEPFAVDGIVEEEVVAKATLFG
jgi:SAM-dependent methyltransferase